MSRNDLPMRVWWSSRIPITKASLTKYPVRSVGEAKKIFEELTNRDLADDSVTDNVGGLEVFENGEWCEWECPNNDCCKNIDRCRCKYE